MSVDCDGILLAAAEGALRAALLDSFDALARLAEAVDRMEAM